MKLSMLDVVPVVSGSTAQEALQHSADLAVFGESLGYHRVWYAEHHNIRSIASAAPEILITNSGAKTQRIRLGAGGVMLPNHAPLRVAEQYRTLNALFPDRVDLGIGRAAGTDPLTAQALGSSSGQYFPQQMAELVAFGEWDDNAFAPSTPYANITVTPEDVPLPPMWMLGSSGGSAELAGQLGMGYGFAGHFSPTPAAPAIRLYRRSFQPSERFPKPHVILALTVVCADTEEEAIELASSFQMSFIDLRQGNSQPLRSPAEARAAGWTPELRNALGPMGNLAILGTPDQVRAQLHARIEEAGGADEVMVMTILHDHDARRRSYELLHQAMTA